MKTIHLKSKSILSATEKERLIKYLEGTLKVSLPPPVAAVTKQVSKFL